MTVVVDLGCADWGTQDSIGELIREYQPDRVYGFDPHPRLEAMRGKYKTVRLSRKAAWTHNGHVRFHENITSSSIFTTDDPEVRCFDFADWLLRRGERVVVKMDVEGAEYDLLERMIATGADSLVDELLVEWHDRDGRADDLIDRLSCPVREWWM